MFTFMDGLSMSSVDALFWFFFLQSDQSSKTALEGGGAGESVIHVSKFSRIAPKMFFQSPNLLYTKL